MLMPQRHFVRNGVTVGRVEGMYLVIVVAKMIAIIYCLQMNAQTRAVLLVGLLVTSVGVGCGDDDDAAAAGASGSANNGGSSGSGGSAGSGGSPSGGSAGSGATAGTSSGGSAGSSTGGSSAAGCALPAACTATDKECVGLTDNSGSDSFGLRMSQIVFTEPVALSTGIFSAIAGSASLLNYPTCNLAGDGTFNWLMQFDNAAKTVKTGGAKHVANPDSGYSFVNENVMGIAVAPATLNYTADGDVISTAEGADVVIPLYLDSGATSVILLPFKQFRFEQVTLSDDNNCVGKYNAEGLSPDSECVGSVDTPTFLNGGKWQGYISLEDADPIVIDSTMQSLCVLLAGSANGDGGMPAKCKRDMNGVIEFQGNWCSSTNTAAFGGCADAMHVAADFAASSVTIQ